ncbi:flavin reductase family protein [Micromonospora sp. NPDC049523]|uniref:flavin reductase family protein n=1 Tax=Micromonospora sp. NPDC049523 TaxID=3155921 RepID=UPI003439D60D
MEIDCAGLDAGERYKLMTGIVVPRPIAWITSRSRSGVLNLAPFSQFTIVSYTPLMVGISIGHREGLPKDTRRNVEETGEFVVNVPTFAMMQLVHHSSADYGPEDSEVDLLGVELVPSIAVGVPGVAQVPIRMECRWHSTTPFGTGGSGFVAGEVVHVHVADDAIDGVKVDTRTIDPLMRLGGPSYARIADATTLPPAGRVGLPWR